MKKKLRGTSTFVFERLFLGQKETGFQDFYAKDLHRKDETIVSPLHLNFIKTRQNHEIEFSSFLVLYCHILESSFVSIFLFKWKKSKIYKKKMELISLGMGIQSHTRDVLPPELAMTVSDEGNAL